MSPDFNIGITFGNTLLEREILVRGGGAVSDARYLVRSGGSVGLVGGQQF